MQIVKPGTSFDLIGKRKGFGVLSSIAISLALLLFVYGSIDRSFPLGPKYGVDFSGGTEIHVKVPGTVDIAQIRTGLAAIGLSDDNVQAFGSTGDEFLIRVENINFGADAFFTTVQEQLTAEDGEQAWKAFEWEQGQSVHMTAVANSPRDLDTFTRRLKAMNPDVKVAASMVTHNAFEVSFPGLTDKVKETLAGVLGSGKGEQAGFEVVSVEMVGPSVGAELRRKGLLSIVLSLALILVYVAFRFDLSFAPGAVAALLHDVIFTIGVFCLLGREFTLPTIGALLTIVGYSLNDTIVVYDRIRENLRRFPRRDLAEVINVSLNETLSRTLLTSVTTIIAVSALMIFGGAILQDFALALFVGVLVGTYSSIYIASPMIIYLQRWLPVDIVSNEDAEKNAARRGESYGATL
ncbi:MAG: protein translocase subunit SecF [Rickettsiales bacterium]|nr:protein translocase subunit SecF [Rickettsiales bacterium]|tara:strand:- start:403 stop:1626 length:1224 start_codon:yes stop_codon:yes gene_type:complete